MLGKKGNLHIGVTGVEPATSASRRQRSTRLSYTPNGLVSSCNDKLA